jgi:hypothetical protein
MLSIEDHQSLINILEYTHTAKPFEFRLITNWLDYCYYRRRHKAYKLLVRGLERSADQLFKKYCKAVTSGVSNVTSLLAYKRLVTAAIFYKKELDTLTDMIDEYETYLFSGNLCWTFILGCPRTEDDMRDFRK